MFSEERGVGNLLRCRCLSWQVTRHCSPRLSRTGSDSRPGGDPILITVLIRVVDALEVGRNCCQLQRPNRRRAPIEVIRLTTKDGQGTVRLSRNERRTERVLDATRIPWQDHVAVAGRRLATRERLGVSGHRVHRAIASARASMSIPDRHGWTES
jgi:hypothetical protein